MQSVSDVLKRTPSARPTQDESNKINSSFEEYYQRMVDLTKNFNEKNRERRAEAHSKYIDAQRTAAKRIASDILGKYGDKKYGSSSVQEYVEYALEVYSGILRPKVE